MLSVEPVGDTKYRNRAMLARWAHAHGGHVEYLRDADGQWHVRIEAAGGEETVIVVSGPQDSIEAGCVVVIQGLREAGQTVD